MHLTAATALRRLRERKGAAFITLFEHGSLAVEIYRPERVDPQQPHSRDEIYVIISGSGEFLNGDQRVRFVAGDFLFVRAGVVHRFENFTDDFATWVFFYGLEGGEG